MIINYTDNVQTNEDRETLINAGKELGNSALNKFHSDSNLYVPTSYSASYGELNKMFKKEILTYCADRAKVTDVYDLNTKEGVNQMMMHPVAEWAFFDIITQTLNGINADNEIEAALQLANVDTVGLGDSKTYEIGSKALYKVQEGVYGNNVSARQEMYKTPITVTPSPKQITIDFDVCQMVVNGYDFGKEIAKVAMSYRAKMYSDIVDEVYTVTAVPTAFYEEVFAKTSYVELTERVNAANGNVGVMTLGTKTAWVKSANGIDSGWSTQDEINKTGFIGNLYGVRSAVLEQAVNSGTAAFAFRVPDDRLIILSSVGDKPAKLVKEPTINITIEDGKKTSLYRRVYNFIQSYDVAIASEAHYGIQAV